MRVDQVEALAVEAARARDVVHRGDDVVDRHDVDAPALDADHRHPLRQEPAQSLQRLEEVHRAVDLVDLAGARIADDHAGTVDAKGHARLAPHDRLGLVLGGEIRVIEPLGLVEHVLAEHAFVQAGGGDRRDVVQAAGADRPGEGDDAPRALDVDFDLPLRVGGEIVDGRQVEQVADAPLQRCARPLADAQAIAGEVALHRHRPRAIDAPERVQRVQPLGRGVAHEKMDDRAASREQAPHEAAADEAGGSGDEVFQDVLPPSLRGDHCTLPVDDRQGAVH